MSAFISSCRAGEGRKRRGRAVATAERTAYTTWDIDESTDHTNKALLQIKTSSTCRQKTIGKMKAFAPPCVRVTDDIDVSTKHLEKFGRVIFVKHLLRLGVEYGNMSLVGIFATSKEECGQGFRCRSGVS